MHITPLSADPLFDVSLLPGSVYVRNTRLVNRLISDDEMPTTPLHPLLTELMQYPLWTKSTFQLH